MVFLLQVRDRNQTLTTEIPPMPRLMVDPYRFRQVLFNFIDNAVKYAGPCTIRVSVVCEGGVFKTTVSDNGRGVPEKKAKLLMEPFVQADIKNHANGSGLGLAICKRLVKFANGTIPVDTAPGKGFTVRTEVPVSLAPREDDSAGKDAAASTPAVSGIPKRVLVVDDSPVNRMVLKAMLAKVGVADVELAPDGAAALELLEKDTLFDRVLSDMWMPAMDGTELVKRIRAGARLSRLKVCSVTADVEARANYRGAGLRCAGAEARCDRQPQGAFREGKRTAVAIRTPLCRAVWPHRRHWALSSCRPRSRRCRASSARTGSGTRNRS